jgi:hypothetical protein
MTNLYPSLKGLSLKCWICCLLMIMAASNAEAQIKTGLSYINVTRNTTGGNVEPGDILEIRFNVMIPWGFNSGNIYKVRYYTNIPTLTAMETAATDQLKILTNEGVLYKGFTLANNDDAGTYIASPIVGDYNIRMNLGAFAPNTIDTKLTTIAGGSLNLVSSAAGSKPKWYSGHLVTLAYRVKVTGALNSTITVGGGRIAYTTTASGTLSLPFINEGTLQILISKSESLCTNKTGANFISETGGTFDKGTTLNRSYGAAFAIPTYSYVNNVGSTVSVNDGSYAIVNNTSPRSGTNTNARHIPTCGSGAPVNDDCNNRMHNGHWDIIGDHTGQTTGASNAPVANGVQSGYMLMVNADMVTSEAFKETISGLCPNTTYEFSAWLKNVCSTCGADSNLASTNLPGVLPNLTFVLDGVDRYTTGELGYGSLWVKRGFTFRTGASQTSIVFSIRNNAQGGGGNDWVMDDISVATCQPNLIMKPYGNATVCYGDPVDFSADVESVFNNYTSWRWEKKESNGTIWNTTFSGTGSPTLSGGIYKYNVPYPPFTGDSAAHGDVIRLRVATTSANLNDNNCSFLAQTQVVILVNNCKNPLSSDITQFKAQPINAGVSLRWAAVNETAGLKYQIEKSTDQRNWKKLPIVNAKVTGTQNNYTELDPGTVYQVTYYRISMVLDDKIKYAQQVSVQPSSAVPATMAINTIQNPFSNSLPFELVVPENGDVNIMLFDMYGKPQKQVNWKVSKGSNRLNLSETNGLSAGNYILMVRFNDQIAQKKVLKTNQ